MVGKSLGKLLSIKSTCDVLWMGDRVVCQHDIGRNHRYVSVSHRTQKRPSTRGAHRCQNGINA